MSKNDLNLIIDDLPESAVPGRSGHSAGAPTAARACRTVSQQELRSQLKHLQGEYNKDQISNIQAKYRKLPDLYYEDDTHNIVTPEKFATEFPEASKGGPLQCVPSLEPVARADGSTYYWVLSL